MMGHTELSQDEVQEILEDLCDEWRGIEYDLLRKNCCHFSEEFCRRLGVGPFPTWVLNLANAGAKLEDSVAPTVERYYLTKDKGKEARGAFLQASTHIGDFTRGLVATGRERRLNAAATSSGDEKLCVVCDCMRGFVHMCGGR
eukprot:TRINITY_DN20234_c0_g1_i1.p1 TRINITY_DN20234_c0_g1~~TRINITY_DN20234_c0_g1_i1.p1  ORF type:complete len:143 (-),score=24.98 TRINITY_DN20234_c0_g1_i1:107-535(-)